MNVAAQSPCTAPAQPPPGLSLIMDKTSFDAWLRAGHPGSRITYYRGHLIVDREPRCSDPNGETRTQLNRLATRALRAAEQSLVHLVQQRHGDGDYSYLAIKAGRAFSRNRGARS